MNEQSAQNLKPMPLWQSWMLFLVAGCVAGVLFTVGMPWLMNLGYRSDDALLLTAAVLSSFLIALTVVLYVGEGRSMSWMELKRDEIGHACDGGLTVELSCGPATPPRTNNRHCTGLTESAAQRAASCDLLQPGIPARLP